MFAILITLLFCCIIFIQSYFYFYFYKQVVTNVNDPLPKSNSDEQAVSVIIAFRNEANNLKNLLPKILNQDYKVFEIIVVNDYSTDNSIEQIKQLQLECGFLKLINNDGEQGKKHALTKGIEASKYPYLLFTDADCYPSSNKWISSMVSKLDDENELVLGYGGYEFDNTTVNAFIQYDTNLIALHYFNAAIIKKAYMGVGRNIAYTKKLWSSVNGFSNHIDIKSGDDDLFVLSAKNKTNIVVNLDKNSYTYSIPAQNFNEYFNQKLRHITTNSKYSFQNNFLAGAEMLSRLLFYVLVFMFLDNPYVFYLFLLRLFLFSFILFYYLRHINDNIKYYHIVIFDIFAPLFYLSLQIFGLFKNKNKW